MPFSETLRFPGIFKKETGLSPFYVIDSDNFIPKVFIFSSLVKTGAEGQIEGDLSNVWHLNENEKSITFELKKNACFHDGSPVTAKDVEWTYLQLKNNSDIFYSRQYTFIEKIEIHNDHVVRFYLNRIPAKLLYLFTFHIVSFQSGADVKSHDFNFSPIGSGPFKFIKMDEKGSIMLESFDHYYGEKPGFKYFHFKSYETRDECWSAFLRGEVDLFMKVDTERKNMLRKSDWCRVMEFPASRFYVLFVNSSHELLRDVRIRRAIEFGIDRSEIIRREFGGDALPIYSLFPESFEMFNESIKRTYDPTRSLSLLDEAGYTMDETSGMQRKDGKNLGLKLLIHPDSRRDLNIAKIVKLQLFKLGIEITIVINDSVDLHTESQFYDDSVGLYLGQKLFQLSELAFNYWEPSFGLKNLESKNSEHSKEFSEVLSTLVSPGIDSKIKKKGFLRLQEIIDNEKNAIFLLYPLELSAFHKRLDINGTDVASPFVRIRGLKQVRIK